MISSRSSSREAPRVLVLGGPSSGKSTFRAQVYQRIQHNPGSLRLEKSVGDLTAIESDVDSLLQGIQPRHTSLNTYNSTTFAVLDKHGARFLLEFADYDGEQVRRMAVSNHLPEAWVERARQSLAWLFFLRIDGIRAAKSFMTQPVAAGPRREAEDALSSSEQSTEIAAIETLQRLLFVRGVAPQRPLISPRLAILLSCWDELPDGDRETDPQELLERRAPLFSRFIGANWQPGQRRIWALSSTEQPLPETGGNADFRRKGPDNFGYVIAQGQGKDRDLTSPLSWLLQSA